MSVRINDAVMHYVSSRRSNLAEQLKAGALAHATRDLALAEEFPLEEQAWQRRQKRHQKTQK